METRQCDLASVLQTNHPARPYFIIGGAVMLLGVLRHNPVGLVMMALGGGVIARGVQEVNRIERLHDGNFHGVNAPPSKV